MNIIYYEDERMRMPVYEFIMEQDLKMRAKIFRNLSILEGLGNMTPMPISRYLEDGILEVRSQTSGNATRILYFFLDGDEAVLTNGFVKKTEETPADEIELAKERRARYIRLKEGGKL